jgi:hypothetical protein
MVQKKCNHIPGHSHVKDKTPWDGRGMPPPPIIPNKIKAWDAGTAPEGASRGPPRDHHPCRREEAWGTKRSLGEPFGEVSLLLSCRETLSGSTVLERTSRNGSKQKALPIVHHFAPTLKRSADRLVCCIADRWSARRACTPAHPRKLRPLNPTPCLALCPRPVRHSLVATADHLLPLRPSVTSWPFVKDQGPFLLGSYTQRNGSK